MPEPKKRPISKQEQDFLNRLRGIEADTDASAQSLEALAKPIEQDLADRETGAIRFNFQYPSIDRPDVDQNRRDFDKYAPEVATRLAKGGFDAATTLAMLSGGGTVPAMGLRAAAKEGIIPLVKAAVGKTLGGMSSAPSRGAFALANGLTGYDEPVEDFGGEVRNLLALGAAKANPFAKFLAPTGSYARDAFRVTYPFAENLGIHYAGKPFEGSGEVFDGTSIGIGPALVGGLQSGMNLLSGNAFRVNQRLPRTVGPQVIERLNMLGEMTEEELKTLAKTLNMKPEQVSKLAAQVRNGVTDTAALTKTLAGEDNVPVDVTPAQMQGLVQQMRKGSPLPGQTQELPGTVQTQSEVQLGRTNIPGMFEPPQNLNFAEFARDRYAKIANMPYKTKEQIAARRAASEKLLSDWDSIVNPSNLEARRKALMDLQIGSVDPELERMLDPIRAFDEAHAGATPMKVYIDSKGMLNYAQAPFDEGMPGNQMTVGSMETPPLMRMSSLKAPVSRETKAAEAVKQTYSWVNSVKHSEEYRRVFKESLENFRKLNPGTLDNDAIEALNVLRSTDNSKEFAKKVSDPKNLAAFNKYFAQDDRVRIIGQRQVINEFINEVNKYNGPKPGSGEKVTGTILDKLTQHSPEEINTLFGRDNAYQSLKDISESFQEAHKYLTDKGMRLEAKSLTFPMIWLGFMAGKQVAMDSSMIAPAAYGITGLALAGNEIMALRPQMLERLLEHNGAGARILKEAWKNPEKNGRYLRLVSALITDNLDKTQKDPNQPPPGPGQ